MVKRFPVTLLCLSFLMPGGLLVWRTASVSAQQNKTKQPIWIYGLELSVRDKGVQNFDANTRKWGVEVFKDENTDAAVAISESGSIALGPTMPTPSKEFMPKGPDWITGQDFRVRRGNEAEFGDSTGTWGVETYRDENANTFLYITHNGSIAQAPAGSNRLKEASTKAPTWLNGMALRVRKAGEADFSKDTRKFGVEVFRDESTGQTVYMMDTGSISAVPVKLEPNQGKSKTPTWLYGLEVRVRNGGEVDFSKDTNRFGIEVFRDENTGWLMYISQVGSLAVVPGKAEALAGGKVKAPTWLNGIELRARKGGQMDFSSKTPKYGLEVFKDENAGNLVYITDTGAIAVMPAK